MSNCKIGILGSFGLHDSRLLDNTTHELVETRYGIVEAVVGELNGSEIVHMTRSGSRHPLPPHAVNYRANMLAFAQLGVTDVITTAMAGSLRASIPVGTLLLLDQFIDFSKTRPSTAFDDDDFVFMDFSTPYCPTLRSKLLSVAEDAGIGITASGCYVGVEGPRYETAAEVRMFNILGGDIVGHTAVTDCIMAREVGLCIATIAGVVNLGAGISKELLSANVFLDARDRNLEKIRLLISSFVGRHDSSHFHKNCSCGKQVRDERQTQKINLQQE